MTLVHQSHGSSPDQPARPHQHPVGLFVQPNTPTEGPPHTMRTSSAYRPRRAVRKGLRWAQTALLIALIAPFSLVAVSPAANGAPATASFFSSSDSPTLVNTTTPREVGLRFTSSLPGTVSGIRFYKGTATKAGDHRAILWSLSGKILAKTAFRASSASGWQLVTFPSPVNINANQTYLVSYYSPAGNYAQTTAGLAQPRRSGPLTTIGGAYRDARGYPRTSTTTNFWVDVAFSYGTTTAPAPTATAPTSAAPTSAAPTSAAPTSAAPTSAAPTSAAPTSAAPTSAAPTSAAPTGAVTAAGNGCIPSTTGQGGYPLPNLVGYANDCNTGPRYVCTTTTQSSLVTSHDGQVIERVCINGSLEIRHNNVTVRDVVVMGTGPYAIDIGQDTATCPANLRVEYTEVNQTNAGNTDWGIYQRCAGGHVFDHVKVMYAGRGIMTYGNLTINQSYVYSNRTNPDAHRTAFSTHGGSKFTLTGNTFICVNTGCSSSLNIYSDYAPAADVLIQGNVLAGGSICLRGGETHTYAAETHDIRVLNNRFSTRYAPECGTLQAFAQFDENAPGNVRSGNVWHETSLPINGE